jgi:hypothetical protein
MRQAATVGEFLDAIFQPQLQEEDEANRALDDELA